MSNSQHRGEDSNKPTTEREEPSPWLDAMREARKCEAAFDWAGAEAAYQRAIASSPDSPGLQHGG